MKKSFKTVAVLFSLLFTLVLTGPVTTAANSAEDNNGEISTYRLSDLWHDDGIEY